MTSNSKVKKIVVACAALAALVLTTAADCTSSSNNDQAGYSNDQGNAAKGKWGNPNVTNFTEYKLALEVAELRDQPNLVMYAYTESLDGSLRCYGKVVGYGIPYSTQITPPYQAVSSGTTEPIREPNALFMPDSAEATWIRAIDPETGKTYVDYVEPRLVISPIKRPCKPLDQ